MKKPAPQRQKPSKRGIATHSPSKNNSSQPTRKSKTTAETASQIISSLKAITRDFTGINIENIIHLSSDIIVSLGKDHKIQTINKAGCQALGYSQKKIIGENWFERFVTPSLRMSALKSLQKLFSGEEDSIGYIVIPIINKKEEEHLIEWEGLALKDTEGSNKGILLSGRDITQQILVEKELIQSEWDMALAQKIAQLGSWVYDIEIDELWWSDEVYRIFGLPKNEFNASYQAFLNTVHPEDREFVDSTNKNILKNNKTYSMDHRIVLPDGSIRTVQQECKTFFNPQGKPQKLRGIVQDITERKQAEEKLKTYQAQLLHAEKLSSIGKLFASIAHEFNNSLFGIRNVLERTKMCVPLKEADECLIDMAISETDRIAKLTRRLNNFFSPTRENKEPVQINRVLEEVVLLAQKELSDRNICLKTYYSDVLPEVTAFPDQIKQVALNLFQNAMEALPETGGEISLSTHHQDSHLYFTVKDDGIGMTEEIRKDIFEPFFTTKSKAEGTGLGLWVTHSIVQSHGGIVEVDSQYGKGASFTVSLPIS